LQRSTTIRKIRICLISLLLTPGYVLLALGAEDYSPYLSEDQPREVFWGDTHLHSDRSTDAMGFGVTLGPEQAYRFASGGEVTSSGINPVTLYEPSEFRMMVIEVKIMRLIIV
jgi:hypothetical protein